VSEETGYGANTDTTTPGQAKAGTPGQAKAKTPGQAKAGTPGPKEARPSAAALVVNDSN